MSIVNRHERIFMESFIIECSGLVVTAIFAVINGNRKQSCIVAVIFMSIINILSQIIIAGGGPTACVGAFVMPLLGIIAALLAIGLKNMI